jgi:REP element-mobilizing transposase RayT
MENQTRTYLFVHLIWLVKNRKPLLTPPIRHVMLAHLRSVCEQKLLKLLSLNGVEDHVHFLIQWHPTLSLSKTIREIQLDSANWLNEGKFLPETFEWDPGYIAYSVSPSQLSQVGDYIKNQELHHRTKSLDSELDSLEKIKV